MAKPKKQKTLHDFEKIKEFDGAMKKLVQVPIERLRELEKKEAAKKK